MIGRKNCARVSRGFRNDDTVIHLGDICIGNDQEVHDQLFSAGGCFGFKKTILVRGKHDKKSLNWYNEHGWDFVCDQIGLEFHRAEEYAGWYDTSFHIDISPEIVGYQPVRLDTLMKGRN
jgi:calcineurin-like phosphoesterase family protein